MNQRTGKSINWEAWISGQLENRKEEYLRDEGDRLISDYNRERSYSRGYTGRALLELIQNADDAGEGCSEPTKLLIQLNEDGLFIANTGDTFSPEGLKSLTISDNSPKQFRNDCIGNKGLGFRSVLGWSSDILILSGDLSVGFSESHSSEFLTDILHDEDVQRKVTEFENRGISNPISILSIPRYISESNIDREKLSRIYQNGSRLMEQGYDTVICVSPEDDRSRERIQQEINTLFEEITLFLHNLGKIRIESPGRNELWNVDRRDNEVAINPGEEDSNYWKIYEDRGEIPPEYREDDQIRNKYEIKLAFPSNLKISEGRSNDLFVFFPTDVSFPFPMLAHATFEVTDNRNHLVKESQSNYFVAKKLASLMVESAEKMKGNGDGPWYGLSLISPTGEQGASLQELTTEPDPISFVDLLKQEAKDQKLVPVRDHSYSKPDDVNRLRGNFQNLLTGVQFADVCLDCDASNIDRFLKELDVDYLEYDELKSRIESVQADFTLDERASVIQKLLANYNVTSDPPELLIDEESRAVPADRTVFLPPEGETITLPSWVPQRILHQGLATQLIDRFDVTRVRDLRSNLNPPYKTQEYSLGNIIGRIVAENNRRAEDEPDRDLEWRKNLMEALWDLYHTHEGNVEIDDRTVIVPTRQGNTKPANSVYFGKEYPSGQILEHLFYPIREDPFVVGPEDLGFSRNIPELQQFLIWLGVGDRPRLERGSMEDPEFFEFVEDHIQYPAEFGNQTISSKADLDGIRNTRLRNVLTIDGLEEFIQNADPHAIICWLAKTSEKLDEWRQVGDEEAVLSVKPYRKKNWRKLKNQDLPSYPLWLIENTDWLPTKNGDRQAPKKCSTSQTAEELSPAIGFPALNSNNDIINEADLDSTSISTTLQKIGVQNSLDGLPWSSFYRILLELPDLDENGDHAKRVYRNLIENKSASASPKGPEFREFQSEGEMLGRMNGEVDYFPLEELYYLDKQTLPDSITNEFSLLELSPRRGSSKVERIFLVDELSPNDVHITNLDYEEHPLASELKSDVQRLKPYVYAIRLEKDTATFTEAREIRNHDVVLCSSVEATGSVKGKSFSSNLDPSSFIIKDDTIYLVQKVNEFSNSAIENDQIAASIGNVFSTIVDVDIQSEVQLLAVSSDRDFILDNLTGGVGAEALEKSKEVLKGEFKNKRSFTPPQPTDPDELSEPNQPPGVGSDQEDQFESEGDQGSINLGEDVEITETPVPTSEPREIKIRRTKKRAKSPTSSGSRETANPDLAERLAVEFEKQRGRRPILVSDLQGDETFGCDVISFSTEAKLTEFLDNLDFDLIDRFIEVKGRSSEKGSITLKGNALKTAEREKENYYLYRIFEDKNTPANYEIVILQDPLNSQEAINRQVEVNPFRTNKSVGFEVHGSLTSRSDTD